MITVTFTTPDGADIPARVAPGVSLMDAARAANVPGILAECGGACSCSTCHVYLDEGWIAAVPPRGEDEADLLDFTFEPDARRSRLSCQIILDETHDGLRATVPARQG